MRCRSCGGDLTRGRSCGGDLTRDLRLCLRIHRMHPSTTGPPVHKCKSTHRFHLPLLQLQHIQSQPGGARLFIDPHVSELNHHSYVLWVEAAWIHKGVQGDSGGSRVVAVNP